MIQYNSYNSNSMPRRIAKLFYNDFSMLQHQQEKIRGRRYKERRKGGGVYVHGDNYKALCHGAKLTRKRRKSLKCVT